MSNQENLLVDGDSLSWDTIEIAAVKLDLTPNALRVRCRRAARAENDQIIARLGMGVIGRKLGTTWRLFVPSADQPNPSKTRVRYTERELLAICPSCNERISVCLRIIKA